TGAEPVRADLNTVSADDLEGVEAIVHCAAHVAEWGRWADFERATVTGTRSMLAAASAAGVSRFIHISTEAALFSGQHMRDVDETAPLAIDSPFFYSRSKAMAETLVREWTGGPDTIVIRPRMVWGEGDRTI